MYKCKASNILGSDSTFTQLNVVELPRFIITLPEKLEEKINQNITIRCQAIGDPKPTVTWAKENGELPVGRSKVNADGTLQIWNLKEASAEVFKAFSAMKLTVTKGEILHPYRYLLYSQYLSNSLLRY